MSANNAIISSLDNDVFVLYSFVSGRFYICKYASIKRLSGLSTVGRKTINIEPDELRIIEDNSIDPDKLDITLFSSPLVIGIMVTNNCNLNCLYCIARQASSYSSTDRFDHYYDKLCAEIASSKSRVLSVMLSGGEPSLNSNLPRFIRRVSNQSYLCLLDTNGTRLSNDLISTIKETYIIPRVSLDSIYPFINDSCRGDTVDVLNSIRLLLENNIQPRINTVLTSANAESINSLAEWIIEKGIKKWHIFKLQSIFAPEWLRISDDVFVRTINRLKSNYSDKIDILCKYGEDKDKYASFVIDSEGQCFSTDNLSQNSSKKIVFGNIENQTLFEIWDNCPEVYKRRHYRKYIYFRK